MSDLRECKANGCEEGSIRYVWEDVDMDYCFCTACLGFFVVTHEIPDKALIPFTDTSIPDRYPHDCPACGQDYLTRQAARSCCGVPDDWPNLL